MPVHPSEEEASSGIFEKVAKDPSSLTESTASDHESHDNEHTPLKASAQDLQSKGPAILQKADGGRAHLLVKYTADVPSRLATESIQRRA